MRKIVLVALLLGGCGLPQVSGNAQGGVIPWSFTNEREVFEAAQKHCQQYNKDARIDQIVPISGGHARFSCVAKS